MNNITDNAFVPTMDAPETDHFEDTDTISDEAGVEARAHKGAHAKAKDTAPEYVLAEFEWRSSVNQVTGEVRWFLSPIKTAVEAIIGEAPGILSAGIDLIEDEDTELAMQMARDITNLMETVIAVDTYQEDALKKHFVNQAARKAIYAVRTARAAEEWSARIKRQGKEEPDNLTAMAERAFSDAKNVAIFRSALLQVDPALELSYKSAAWDVMKYLAYANQQKYLNPDEIGKRQDNASGATGTLLGRLRNRQVA